MTFSYFDCNNNVIMTCSDACYGTR